MIYFPDFCDLCLERFREGEDADDNFRKTIFKVISILADNLVDQMDENFKKTLFKVAILTEFFRLSDNQMITLERPYSR